jgi:predicted acyltransferase
MNATPGRLHYLDQFRGYTIVGMIVVNFLGAYQAVHPILKHHSTYCSYADTIMPQFFLAVGFALRFTIVRRIQTEGWRAAHWRVVRRVLALLVIAALVHQFDRINLRWAELVERGPWYFLVQTCSRSFFQTLTHIAVTTLWVLPVIAAAWPTRLVWLLASATLHVILLRDFYLEFALNKPVIDGGPLGFLTWTIPVLFGSLACDVLTTRPTKVALAQLTVWAVVLMGLGYGLSCLTWGTPAAELGWVQPAALPFVPPDDPKHLHATYEERNKLSPKEVVTLWMMSQRTGSVSYQTFATGFSLGVLVLCVVIFGESRQLGVFRTLGTNALVAYIVHGLADDLVGKVLPKDAPPVILIVACAGVIGLTWLVCRYLEKRGWYLRV